MAPSILAMDTKFQFTSTVRTVRSAVFVFLAIFIVFSMVLWNSGVVDFSSQNIVAWNDNQISRPTQPLPSIPPVRVRPPKVDRDHLLQFINNQWTHCRPLSANPGWKLEHCAAPPTEEGCQPGSGYIRIQRVVPPSLTNITTCFDYDKPGFQPRQLSKNASLHDYVAFSLGPDAYSVEMVGPERHTWIQQQILGNCTVALPYHVSTPGRYWVTKVRHPLQNFEGFDELAPMAMWPFVLLDEVLQEDSKPAGRSFDVCQEFNPLPPSLEFYIGSYSGAYKAVPSPTSYEEALDVDRFQWVSRAHPLSMENIVNMTSLKPSTSLLEKPPSVFSCLADSKLLYQYLGDSHIRVLSKAHVYLYLPMPGVITSTHEMFLPSVQVHSMEVIYKFENHFRTVDRILDAYDAVNVSDAYQKWAQTLSVIDPDTGPWKLTFTTISQADVLTLGWGHWQSARVDQGGHWATDDFLVRSEELFRRFLKMQDRRRGPGKKPLLLAWNGIPATTESNWPQNNIDGDWRTNQRLGYWDRLVSGLVDRLNEEQEAKAKEEGATETPGPAIIKLHAFDKTLPYMKYSADGAHFLYKNVVSAQLGDMLPHLRAITGC